MLIMNINAKTSKLVVICVILLMECVFFREIFVDGAMIGDRGDARLNNLIVEHFYSLFCGKENFFDLNIFYPMKNTISYTDMNFLISLPYSIFRFIGFDMFSAYKTVLISLHVFGSLTLFYFLNTQLKLDLLASLLGVSAFSFANGYSIRMVHTQMMAISFLPMIFICAGNFFINFRKKYTRRIHAVFGILSLSAIAYTSWYNFFFLILFLCIFLPIFIYNSPKYKVNIIYYKSIFPELIIYFLFFVILLIPFYYIYSPTVEVNGYRTWNEICFMLPQIIDIFNVGIHNFLLGNFFDHLHLSSFRNKYEWEVSQGYSIILLASLIYFIFYYIRNKKNVCSNKIYNRPLINPLIISITFSIILPLEFHGYSLWYIIYKFFPGAQAIRGVSRYYFFLLLPIGILLALLVDFYRSRFHKHYKFSMYALISILFLSNILCGYSKWDTKNDYELLDYVSAPPSEAKVFLMVSSNPLGIPFYINMLDAWLIANKYNLKTINGYSGLTPKMWNFFDISDENRMENLHKWHKHANITEDIYLYDKSKNEWQKWDDNIPYKFYKTIYTYQFNNNISNDIVNIRPMDGFYDVENWGRWISDNSRFIIKFNHTVDNDLLCEITMHSFHKNRNIDIYINGEKYKSITITPFDCKYILDIDKNTIHNNMLTLGFVDKDGSDAPKDIGINDDVRKLSIGMKSLTLKEILIKDPLK